MNESLFFYLNNFAGQSTIADTVIIFFSQYLIYILIAGAAVFLCMVKERRFEKLIVIFGGAALAWIISQGINALFPVARPFLIFPDAHLLFSHGGYDSFPSGHAAISFALALGLLYYQKPLAWLYVLLALIIGVSRIIAGVHWPIDVAGSFLLGGAIVFLVHRYYNGRENKHEK